MAVAVVGVVMVRVVRVCVVRVVDARLLGARPRQWGLSLSLTLAIIRLTLAPLGRRQGRLARLRAARGRHAPLVVVFLQRAALVQLVAGGVPPRLLLFRPLLVHLRLPVLLVLLIIIIFFVRCPLSLAFHHRRRPAAAHVQQEPLPVAPVALVMVVVRVVRVVVVRVVAVRVAMLVLMLVLMLMLVGVLLAVLVRLRVGVGVGVGMRVRVDVVVVRVRMRVIEAPHWALPFLLLVRNFLLATRATSGLLLLPAGSLFGVSIRLLLLRQVGGSPSAGSVPLARLVGRTVVAVALRPAGLVHLFLLVRILDLA